MSEPIPVNRPQIAAPRRRAPIAAAGAMSAMIGIGVFFWLAEARASIEDGESQLPALSATATTPEPAPAALAGQQPAASAANQPASQPFFIPNSGPVTLVSTPPSQSSGYASGYVSAPAPASPVPATGAADRQRERRGAPTLIIDLARADSSAASGSQSARSDSGAVVRSTAQGTVQGTVQGTAQGTGQGGAAPVPVPGGTPADRDLSDTERFSARVGTEEVEVARARRMTGLDRLIPQGAVLGAVMETALNSDLPGFARATVQRDVRSFDGSAVLIPAGSRLIGQYKSGLAQGASRVFVLWTRLIRPDGVSIELASPATDELGRGGIGGKVNRHFLRRFGGGILTSVISGGINAAAAALSGGSTIIVGSAGEAATLARQAGQTSDIPPTITTRQGAAVRVFVARDLDFSQVGPAR